MYSIRLVKFWIELEEIIDYIKVNMKLLQQGNIDRIRLLRGEAGQNLSHSNCALG